MLGYIVRRLLQLVPVLLGITLLVFLIFHLTADPTQVILGLHGSPEQREALREELGLNDPILVQYARYVGGALRGDLGESWMRRTPVAQEIADKFPHTLELAVVAMVLAVSVGLVAGVLAAVRPYTMVDYLSSGLALAAVSVPVFVLGLLLITLFAVKLEWLPINGRMDPLLLEQFRPPSGFYLTYALLTRRWQYAADLARHMVLPAVALASTTTALLVRITRATMLEVIRQDYIRTARAKGLSERVVIYRHALKNAMIPVVTVIGLQFGTLLGGAILTETVFTWPGLGTLTLRAVEGHDLPLVQGIVILLATLFVLANLAVDILYAALDPRIKYA